jgi:hypothetical protein
MATRTPRRPRSWLDALIAASLRWNDRLGRSLGVPPSPDEAARGAAAGGASGTPGAGAGLPVSPGSRTR